MYEKYVKVYLISFTKVYGIFFAYVKYTNAKFSTIVIFFKETVSIYTIKIIRFYINYCIILLIVFDAYQNFPTCSLLIINSLLLYKCLWYILF